MDGWTELNGGVPPVLCWQSIRYAEYDSCVEEGSIDVASHQIGIHYIQSSQRADSFGHLLSDRYSDIFFGKNHLEYVPRNSCDLANEVFDRQIYESRNYDVDKRSSILTFSKHDPVIDAIGNFDKARNLYYEYMFADAEIDARLPGAKPSYMELRKFGLLRGEDSGCDANEQAVLVPETARADRPMVMPTTRTENTKTAQLVKSNDKETEEEEMLSVQDFAIATMGIDTRSCDKYLSITSLDASANPASCKNQSLNCNKNGITTELETRVSSRSTATSNQKVEIENVSGNDETTIIHNYRQVAKASEESLCSLLSPNTVSISRRSVNSSADTTKPAGSFRDVHVASPGYFQHQPLFTPENPTLSLQQVLDVRGKRFPGTIPRNHVSSSLLKPRSIRISKAKSHAKLVVIKKRSAPNFLHINSSKSDNGIQQGLHGRTKKVCVKGSEWIGQEEIQKSKHLCVSAASFSSESWKLSPASIGCSSSQTLPMSSALNGYQGQFEMRLPNSSSYTMSSNHYARFGRRTHPNGEFIHTAFTLDPRGDTPDFTFENLTNDDALLNMLHHADEKSIEAASDAMGAHRTQSQENLRREGLRECSTARLEGVPVGFYRYFQGHLTVEEYKDAKMCVCWNTCSCNKLCTLYGDLICPCNGAIVLEED